MYLMAALCDHPDSVIRNFDLNLLSLYEAADCEDLGLMEVGGGPPGR